MMNHLISKLIAEYNYLAFNSLSTPLTNVISSCGNGICWDIIKLILSSRL